MSNTLSRVLVASLATGSAAVLFAAPAGAASANGVTSSPAGQDRAPAAVGRAAGVDERTTADLTGAAAAKVGFRISGATCYSTQVAFTADTYETGVSGVQRFRQKAQLQKFTTGGWVAATGTSVATSTAFANDARSFHFARDWKGNHAVNGGSWRMLWQGSYLNGFGQVVAQTKQIAITCA